MASPSSGESDFKAALADLAVSKKGDEHLEIICNRFTLQNAKNVEPQFLRRPFYGEKVKMHRMRASMNARSAATRANELSHRKMLSAAKKIASTDALHRSRAFERVASLDDEDRVYVEEAIQHYLPRPLYVLTTIINRLDGLNLTAGTPTRVDRADPRCVRCRQYIMGLSV